MRLALILVAVFTACVACVAQEPGVEKLPIQPKPAIQERFDAVIAALNNSPDPPEDNIEARREVKDLKDSVADKGEIVKQLVAYAAVPDDEVQSLKALMILHLLDLPPKIIIPELAPYLDDDDIEVSSFVGDWFRGHDNIGPGETKLKPVNFEDYVDYVGSGNVPTAFVEYLFERSPNRAFLVFVHAAQKSKAVRALEALREKMDEKHPGWDKGLPQAQVDRGDDPLQARPGRGDGLPLARAGYGENKNELLLAEHVISNAIWLRKIGFDDRFPNTMREAIQQLSQLSEHEQWWVRLYVAETMQQNREFRQAEVLEKLSRDSNELVSKAAQEKHTKGAASPRDEIPGALVAPRDVHARALGGGRVQVEWSPSIGATSYDVQRRQPDTETEFTTIATDVKGTTYTDNTGGESGTLYEYRIVAQRRP
jgi:hypothetical protein